MEMKERMNEEEKNEIGTSTDPLEETPQEVKDQWDLEQHEQSETEQEEQQIEQEYDIAGNPVEPEQEEEQNQEEVEFVKEAREAIEESYIEDGTVQPEYFIPPIIQQPLEDMDTEPSDSIPLKQRFSYIGQRFLEDLTDADPNLKELAILHMFTVSAERYRIPDNTTLTDFGKQLNLYMMLYGEARKTHKTSIYDAIKEVLFTLEKTNHSLIHLDDQTTAQSFYSFEKLTQKMCKKTKAEAIKAGVPEEVCNEELESIRRRYKILDLSVDEAQNYIADMNNPKSVYKDLQPLISKLYTGGRYRRVTCKYGEEILDNPYLNVYFTGTPDMPKSLTIQFFETGHGVKYIYYDIKKPTEIRPKKDKLSQQGEMDRLFVLLYTNLLYSVKTYVPIKIEENARKKISEFTKKKFIESEAQLEKDPCAVNRVRDIYYGNLENLIEKIASYYCIDRSMSVKKLQAMKTDDYRLKGEDKPVVYTCDVLKAISFVERIVLTGFEATIKLVRYQTFVNNKIPSNEEVIEVVAGILKRSSTETANGIVQYALPMGTLSRQLKISYRNFQDLISSMENMGYIEQIHGVQMKRGAPAILVKLMDNPEGSQ